MSNSSFSFDLYPGVDAELEAAYQRNTGQDPTSQLGSTGLAAAVAQQVAGGNRIHDHSESYINDLAKAEKLAEGLFVEPNTASEIGFNNFLNNVYSGSEREERVAQAYETMQKLGLEPMIIIGLANANYTSWVQRYNNLPNTKNGGLYVDEEIAKNWQDLPKPKEADAVWFVSVVPATPKPTIISDHSLNWHNQSAVETVVSSDLPFNSREDIAASHITIAEYLTLQAFKLANNEQPIDAETYTWLAGTFDNNTKAPYGDWNPDDGQVKLRWRDPSVQFDRVGSRPAVRGVEL